MRTGSQAPETFVPVALSDQALAIALEPTGVPHPRLRAALVQAAQEGWLSCTAQESANLLLFFRDAGTYFREVRNQDLARICLEAHAAIAQARHRAGLPAVHRLPGPPRRRGGDVADHQ